MRWTGSGERGKVETAMAADPDEGPALIHLRPRALVLRIETELDLLLRELRTDLEKRAVPAHRRVLAHRTRLAMQEDFREPFRTRRGPELAYLAKTALAWWAGPSSRAGARSTRAPAAQSWPQRD